MLVLMGLGNAGFPPTTPANAFLTNWRDAPLQPRAVDSYGHYMGRYYYNGLPEKPGGYVYTYNAQRGAVPGGGAAAVPLRVLPVTGIGNYRTMGTRGLGAAADDAAASFAQRVKTQAETLVAMRRTMLAIKSGGGTPKLAMVRAYTDGKLLLALALSQVCGDNPGLKIRVPRELKITVTGGCLETYDLPPSPGSESGIGFIPVLVAALPAIKVAILATGAAVVGMAALKYIAPQAEAYLARSEQASQAYAAALEACGSDAACLADVATKMDASGPEPPPDAWAKISGTVALVVGLAAAAIAAPYVMRAFRRPAVSA